MRLLSQTVFNFDHFIYKHFVKITPLSDKEIYLDAKFPKDFCLANAAQLLGAKGCQEFIVDLCSSDPSLASSPQCAGQLTMCFSIVLV